MRAQLALNRNDASKTIEVLQAASPYELGSPAIGSLSLSLYPIYVRGGAYLSVNHGSEAAAEFQRILDHRGIVLNEAIGALAHLGLARAYVLQGDTIKAAIAIGKSPSNKDGVCFAKIPRPTFSVHSFRKCRFSVRFE